MFRSFLIVASLSLSLISLNETFAELQGILVEGEDFDGIEQFSIWQTCNGRWYAKEHLAAYAMGGAYAVANEFSIGAVMETKLERPLPAGKYSVWVRVVIWTDSDDAVEIDLNGARRIYEWTIKTSGRGYRWLKGEITTTREGNVLQAKAVKASQQNFGESPRPPCRFFVLDSIYISLAGEEARVSSTRKNDELVIDGRLLTCYGLGAAMTNQVSNTEVKTTEPPKGNLIGNGSFEIGFSRGWTARSKFGILNEQHLDGTTSKHGNFSLCTRNAKDETILNPIHSGAIHIAAQGLYTLSAWVKTQTPGRISLGLVPVKGRRAVLSKAATSQTEWQRISVTGQLKSGEYYVSISGGHFWLDGVQLEPGGKASEFQQRVPVSAGVLSDLPGNVYFEGENERPKLLVYADESLKKSKVTVRCRVYDIWGSETIEKKIRVPLKKNRAELDAGFLPDRLGSFRAELSVDGFPNSETEFVFSILPKPRTMGIDRHSWLATMPESKEYVLASLQRAGFKWMQNIRDTQVARWMYAEPEQGKIVWHDKLVSRSRRHGIEPVILLHVNYNRLPKWVKPTAANKNVPQDVSLWKRFVTRMVDHYKGQVKYWQLSDDIHHYFTADEYAMLLKATWEAAKKADPDCVVIGWRFFNREVPGWEEAFKKTEPYSDIIYAGDKQLRQKYGKQLHSYRFISAPTMYNFPALGAEARLASLAKGRSAACTGLVRAFCVHAESVGYVDALFYYMAYLGTPSYVTNRSKQTFEHCGSIHLGAVTLRMLDHFLYRMECLGNISLSKAVAAYHFRRGNDSCVVAWSTEGQKVALNFSERLTGLNVFNAMGNPIKPDRRRGRTTLSLYDTPIFISGKAVSPDRMATLFKNVDSKLELAVYPVLSAKGGRLHLGTLVTNNTRRTTKVELKVAGPRYFPLKWNAPTEVRLSLKKGQDQTASFPLKYGLGRSAEFKNMQLDVGAGDGLSYSKRWVLWLMNSRPRTVPVNLDGKLDEWKTTRPSRITTTHVSGATRRMKQVRTGAITSAEELTQGRKPIIRGPEDISLEARSQWDDQKIYFACEVRDDAVEEGDTVQLFFDTDVAGDRAEESLSNDDLVFTCAVSQEGNIVGKLKRSEVSSDIPVACRQNDLGYVIEFAVPWNSLNIKPAAGTTIGFDIAVTDTDKGSLHAQVVWAGASYNWGNPMGFGTLVLGE